MTPCRWLFVLLYFLNMSAYGQKDTTSLITVNFDNTTVPEFLNSVEEQTSLHFFYDTAQLGTVRITIHAFRLHLREVLDQAFTGTDIYYAVDGENHWFITRDNPLDFSFTPGPPPNEIRSKKQERG